jgi:hypothetical protein
MSWLNGKWHICRLIETTEKDAWYTLCTDVPGVYRLIGLDESRPDIVPATINRICGIDPTGTLNIGATKSLPDRLGSLVRTHDPKFRGGSHRKLPAKMAKRFPPKKLALAWQCADQPYEREGEMLDRYEAQFGEMPPLYRQ